METKQLMEVMDQQYSNLNTLLEIVKKKQQALVDSEIENLESCIRSEEKILFNIQSVEKLRYEVVSKIISEYGLDENDYSISSINLKLQDKISTKNCELLLRNEKEIKETAYEIIRINEQNKFLIQHSRQFINETINTLLNSNKDSIFDRKG